MKIMQSSRRRAEIAAFFTLIAPQTTTTTKERKLMRNKVWSTTFTLKSCCEGTNFPIEHLLNETVGVDEIKLLFDLDLKAECSLASWEDKQHEVCLEIVLFPPKRESL